MSTISDEIKVYAEIRERLVADLPDLDEQTLLDTLEGSTTLQERLLDICRAAREAEAWGDVCGGMINDLKARKTRHENRAERLRGLVLWALQEVDIPKIIAPDMTITVGKGRTSVVITDPNALPLGFAEFVPQPDKAKIKTALEAGELVSGASLSNSGPSLSIRTK